MIPLRKLGSNGPIVSLLGFGTWQLSGPFKVGGRVCGLPNFNEQLFIRILKTAFDKGVNFFETSNVYGRSEDLLGQCCSSWGDGAVIASKCGINRNGEVDISPSFIRASLENTLTRLGIDCIDIYQLTVPDYETYDVESGFQTMSLLKKEGKIKWVGASVRTPGDGLKVVRERLADIVQLTYNLFDVRFGTDVIPEANHAGLGVIVKSPLNKGVLTGKYPPDTIFHDKDSRKGFLNYERLNERNKWLDGFCIEFNVDRKLLTDIALRFVFSNQMISTVALGMSSMEQLITNIDSVKRDNLKPQDVKAMELFSRQNWSTIGGGLWNKLIR